MEFATEIGQSLLVEVRRLQSLLTERDGVISNLERDQQMLTQTVEDKDAALATMQESVDQFKDHNWTLEVQLQDLTRNHNDLSEQHTRSETDRLKTSKALSAAQSELESQRLSLEQAHRELEDERSRRELEQAEMRKNLAGLKREKSDLQGALDQAKGDMAKSAARRSISGQIAKSRSKKSGLAAETEQSEDEELEGGMADEDVFAASAMSPARRGFAANMHQLNNFDETEADGEADVSMWPTSPGIQRGSKGENEALRNQLAHAQKTIGTLKNALTREKEKVSVFHFNARGTKTPY